MQLTQITILMFIHINYHFATQWKTFTKSQFVDACLDVTPMKIVYVQNAIRCNIACYTTSTCKSVAYQVTDSYDSLHECHLYDTDIRDSRFYLRHLSDWIYYTDDYHIRGLIYYEGMCHTCLCNTNTFWVIMLLFLGKWIANTK